MDSTSDSSSDSDLERAAVTQKRPWMHIVFDIAMVSVQIYALSHYMAHFPTSLWTGSTSMALNTSCRRVFGIMRWTVMAVTICLILELASRFAQKAQCFKPVVQVLSCIFCFAPFIVAFTAVWGVVVVIFRVDHSQSTLEECSDLYWIAFFTYLGQLILVVCIWASLCCIATSAGLGVFVLGR
ncbi:unnamed protein product [Effrenium voratum]|nr:unnamed protein product [Effrenium voratum]